eukprot:Lankesteria_metandrocarpae@DN4447_c1_g1_i1.p1
MTSIPKLYVEPPITTATIGVGDFCDFAICRLEVLQAIDRLTGPVTSAAPSSHTADAQQDSSKTSNLVKQLKPKLQEVFGSPIDDVKLRKINTKRASLSTTTGAHSMHTGAHSGATVEADSNKRAPLGSPFADEISHFALRLSFAQQDRERQDWFIRQELKLLSTRLAILREFNWDSHHHVTSSSTRDILTGMADDIPQLEFFSEFLGRHGIETNFIDLADIVDDQENTMVRTSLAGGSGIATCAPCSTALAEYIVNASGASHANIRFALKVPFWPDAVPFLRRRRCLIRAGYAYIPLQDVEEFVLQRFRRTLIESFKTLASREAYMQREIFLDPRLSSLFEALRHNSLLATTRRKTDDALDESSRLSPLNLTKFASTSFPPCMRQLTTTLQSKGHLKYQGRLQLWLFYRACGMTLDEQLSFWKSCWGEPDKFDKQHRYNIRHVYGLEGRRVAYSSYPCAKIIHSLPVPGPSEVHGCPFKLFDKVGLRRLLSNYALSADGHANTDSVNHNVGLLLDKSVGLADAKHVELACVEFFKATHPSSTGDNIGVSPFDFYKESRRYHERAQKADSENQMES